MVYCIKCGAKNEEGTKYCAKCGANVEVSQEEGWERRVDEWGEEFGKRAEEWGEDFGKKVENECFGLPRGGAIFGLFIGIIIIIFGLQQIFGLDIELGPFIIIIIGILILAGAIYGLSRR